MARTIHDVTDEGSFFRKYCERYRCKPERFEKDVLWRCQFPILRPVAPIIGLVFRDFFKPDMDLIADAKDATRISEISATVNFYKAQERDFIRKRLNMRMSKGKLLAVATRVFRSE